MEPAHGRHLHGCPLAAPRSVAACTPSLSSATVLLRSRLGCHAVVSRASGPGDLTQSLFDRRLSAVWSVLLLGWCHAGGLLASGLRAAKEVVQDRTAVCIAGAFQRGPLLTMQVLGSAEVVFARAGSEVGAVNLVFRSPPLHATSACAFNLGLHCHHVSDGTSLIGVDPLEGLLAGPGHIMQRGGGGAPLGPFRERICSPPPEVPNSRCHSRSESAVAFRTRSRAVAGPGACDC